jgi:hypothetical protein
MLWHVRKISFHRSNDLTILNLEPASEMSAENTFVQAALTTRVPEVGDRIMVAGFRAKSAKTRGTGTGIEFEGSVLCATGSVEEVFLGGRDRVILPFASVQVGCFSKGGMSGGPAFDASGRLIGVVTSSMVSDDERGPTFISMIWPCLPMPIEAVWPHGIYPDTFRLLDLPEDYCRIDDRSVFSLGKDPITGEPKYFYRAHSRGPLRGRSED